MARFEPFNITPEVIESFRSKKQIPAHLYSKEGQILIHGKENATDTEIDRLLRFADRGIYFNVDDADTLGIKVEKRNIPEGLSDVKLIGQETAQELTRETSSLMNRLKEQAISADLARRTKSTLGDVFSRFEQQPDAMVGLVNILESMRGVADSYDVQLAVKRTVVSMAMKTRGMNAVGMREREKMNDLVSVTMLSALFCDVGTARMKMPTGTPLSEDEMKYVRNHPMMSYLTLAHQEEIDPRVKRNILVHHRPMRQGLHGNNYPDIKTLLNKLSQLAESYRGEYSKTAVVTDLNRQIVFLKNDLPYDEDANIIAIASEFASLTSETAWRPAFEAERAVRMIINNSYFTYADRGIREFLDHTAISLCDNKKILTEGDFAILASRTIEGKNYYEACQITQASRFQSRPGVDRIAEITPFIRQSPRIGFAGWQLDTIRPDRRFAHFELAQDDTRRIVYAVDPQHDEELHARLVTLVAGRKRPVEHQQPEVREKKPDS